MENKKGRGRPKVEDTLPENWKDIILQSGREGKHLSDFVLKLGYSYESHYQMIKRNREYSDTIKEYNVLCEQWWYEQARTAVERGESNKFNQRLWTVVMKNKFRDNWSDDKNIDITTQGEKIGDNSIQVEIIRKTLE